VPDTTHDLLGEKGYAGFALTEVSRRSGVSVGSIYTRVDSKDDLLRAGAGSRSAYSLSTSLNRSGFGRDLGVS
jgi:AcrR family transcriptional regulator